MSPCNRALQKKKDGGGERCHTLPKKTYENTVKGGSHWGEGNSKPSEEGEKRMILMKKACITNPGAGRNDGLREKDIVSSPGTGV